MSGNCRQKKVKTRIIFVELWETSEIIVSTRVNESPGNGNWATEAVSLITSFVDMLLDLHIVKAILRFSFFYVLIIVITISIGGQLMTMRIKLWCRQQHIVKHVQKSRTVEKCFN